MSRQAFHLLLLYCFLDGCISQTKQINIVGLFEPLVDDSTATEDFQAHSVFLRALDYVKFHRYIGFNVTLVGYTENATNQDGYHLSQYICETMRNVHIAASMGVRSKPLRNYMHIISNKKSIPYIELLPTSDYSRDMIIQMHPSPDDLVEVLELLLKQWHWSNVLLIYESNDALITYNRLLKLHKTDGKRVNSHQLSDPSDFSKVFEVIERLGVFHIIVNCRLQTIPPFLNKALEMQMLLKDYHYHFTSLDMHVLNLSHYSYGGANITWSQLINKTGAARDQKGQGVHEFETFLKVRGMIIPPLHYFTTYNALIVDSLIILAKALTKLLREPAFYTQSIECESEDYWQAGFGLRNYIKSGIEGEGLSGNIQFHTTSGKRVNYTIMIMQLQKGGVISDIGHYKHGGEMLLKPYPKPEIQDVDEDDYFNRVLRVTTLQSKPFLMVKETHNGQELHGNDRFEGFVVDFMEHISRHIPIKYELHLAVDGEWGAPQKDGTFNGMVGEVMNKEADMAVGDLTINYDREQAIDFTKPFMTFGIAILYKKPKEEPPHLLSFMEPIKIEVWGTIVVALVIVSLSMYIFSRFSPLEWENPFPCDEDYKYMVNEFHLSNAFWFTVGSIMQQGCEIMPKAPSTRIIAIAWWLFTLIIISSYTANLAAFLTITTLSETFENVDDLAAQTTVPYGCKENGNTCLFFEKSNISVYKKMWGFMSSTKGALAHSTPAGVEKVKNENYAFFMESSVLQYEVVTDKTCQLTQVGPLLNSLSYGIGVRSKSGLRDILSNVILKLNENQVLLELYNKWWKVDDNRCNKEKDDSTSDLKLKLENLGGVFVFLMGGLGIGFVVLCIEVLAFAAQKSQEEQMPFCKVLGIWLSNSLKGNFPSIFADDSFDRSQENSVQLKNNKHMIKSDTKEGENEPLNQGHPDMVPCSTTTETFFS